MNIYHIFIALTFSSVYVGASTAEDLPWTLVGLGDTQILVKSEAGAEVFTNNIQWVLDHQEQENILFVTQLGDIVSEGGYGSPSTPAPTVNNERQWRRAEEAMSLLDGSGIGWGTAVGNHELDWVDVAPGVTPNSGWWRGHNPDSPTPPSGFEIWKSYFGPGTTGRYDDMEQFGGAAENDLDTYYLYEAGGRRYLHLHLQLDVPDRSIDWAQGVIDAHAGLPTIVSTHIFEGTQHGPPHRPYVSGAGRNSAHAVWDKLITGNDQIFLVLSGHTGQAQNQTRINDLGNPVFTLVQDYAFMDNTGEIEGYIRLYEFDESNGVIKIKTYSPTLDEYLTGESHQFELHMDWTTTRFSGALGVRGDLNQDGFVGFEDLDILLANWGPVVKGDGVAPFDINDDGMVGQADLDVIIENWADGDLPDINVPEPTSASALSLGAMVLRCMRRGR